MVLDGLGGGREPCGDLAIAQPRGHEQQDLELAWGKAEWIGARRRTGSTGQAANASLSQPLEDDQRLALGGLVAIEERQRLLVGTGELRPLVRRRTPVASYLQGKGAQYPRWRLGQATAPPQPDGGLAQIPHTITGERHLNAYGSLVATALLLVLQPALLGACGGRGGGILRLASRPCHVVRLIQQRFDARVTPPRAYEAKYQQRRNTKCHRRPGRL